MQIWKKKFINIEHLALTSGHKWTKNTYTLSGSFNPNEVEIMLAAAKPNTQGLATPK